MMSLQLIISVLPILSLDGFVHVLVVIFENDRSKYLSEAR
jgi:hypothetical protein